MPLTGSQKALMFSQSGVERCGATRCGYHSAKTFLTVGGVLRRTNVVVESLTVTQALDDLPDTCAFTATGFMPREGQAVVITLGSINNPDPLFSGHIIRPTYTTFEKLTAPLVQVQAIDSTWLFNRTALFSRYVNRSVADMLRELLLTYAPDFSLSTSTLSLTQTLDEITFTHEDLTDAFSRILKRIGGYWYQVNKVFHGFVGTETGVTTPRDLDETHPSLRDLIVESDLAPQVTRVTFEGNGSSVPSDVLVGETILPVEDVTVFNYAGGQAVSGPQRLTYAGTYDGAGVGSIVGPGVAPSAAPTLTIKAGAGLGSGTYQYGYTDVTAAGESLPSPLATIVTGASLANPVGTPVIQNSTNHAYGASWAIGDQLYLRVSYLNAIGETLMSTQSGTITAAVSFGSFPLDIDATSLPICPDPAVVTKNIYLYVNGAFAYSGSVPNNSGSRYNLQQNGFLGGASSPPAANTTAGNQVDVSAIAKGPSSVTSRKLYRTAVGGSQLKLVTTIANNTAVTYSDATADGGLGANAPTSDTSGLTPPTGQVNAGSTTLPVASSGSFPNNGGWARVSGQAIRFTEAGKVANPVAGAIGINTLTAADGNLNDGVYRWQCTYVGPIGETLGDSQLEADLTGSGGGYSLTIDIQPIFAAPAGAVTMNIYRTVVNGSQLKLMVSGQAVTTHTYKDQITDAALGANIPTTNTTAGANSLAGIPATGAGSITASIAYGQTIQSSPVLTGIPSSGVGAIVVPINRGDDLNLIVTVNDLAAQAERAALIGGGDTGIREDYRQDRRLSETEAAAQALAWLTLRKTPRATARFRSRDLNTVVGRTVAIPGSPGLVLANGAIGYWRLGEVAGPAAIDGSGNSRHGTYTGTYALGAETAMKDGNTGLTLAGAGYVTMGDVAAFEFTGAFSVECWVKFTSAGTVMFVSKAQDTTQGWRVYAVAGVIAFDAFTSAPATVFQFATAATFNDGAWHHVVCTWDGTTGANKVRIYVDGVVRAQTTAAAGTPGTGTAPGLIGAYGTSFLSKFSGSIDDVALYPLELSATQVAADSAKRAWPYPTGTFKIQDVVIREFSADGKFFPIREVTASSERFSFEDLLRQIPRT